MTKTIKWGILGPGKIAHKFAEGLLFTKNASLVAVASTNQQRANDFAAKYNIAHVHNSYKALAENPDVDIIYIATPHSFHYEHTLLCLNSGKAVLCEKPFALNEWQANEMINTARKNNVFLMEAMWARFMPGILKTIELVQSGAIGKIVHIRADFGFKSHFDPQSRLFNPALGGGALLDIGIYPLFLPLLLLGEPSEITSSASITSTGVDESMAINLKYNNGALASLYCTLLANTSTDAIIFGTEGHIHLNRFWYKTNTVTLANYQGQFETFDFQHQSYGYENEAQEAVNCILNGKTESELMPHSFSLMQMKVMDSIRKQQGIVYEPDKQVD